MSKLLKNVRRAFLASAIAMVTSTAAAQAPLADAVERRDRGAIERWMESIAPAGPGTEKNETVNAAQADGMTALHWAVYLDDAAMMGRLVAAGANVNAANRYGVRPLHLACAGGNAAIVRSLLEAGADVNATWRGGETALMTAARTGIVAPVEALIQRGAQVNATEDSGQTALMWAAAEGHADVVRSLLAAGADANASLESGFTSILFAARAGRIDVVRLLIDQGVDFQAAMDPRRPGGKMPSKGTSALTLAIVNGHYDLAVMLVEEGADANDTRTGLTPLHTIVAVRKPNRGDGPDGDPPPRGSGRLDSLGFVRRLVELGADVNRPLTDRHAGTGQLNFSGATPFLLAADTADVPLMRLLVELGADPLTPNADGCTPLMAAAGIGTLAPGEEAGTEDESLAAVELIFALGGDVNTVDDNGETAMHGAAYKSQPKVVHWLAEHGARVEVWNKENRYGWTPLEIAQGYRPGNFRPSADTIEAIMSLMP